MGYSGARGTLIYEKNLMSKISCQTPFYGVGGGNEKWRPWMVQKKTQIFTSQALTMVILGLETRTRRQ